MKEVLETIIKYLVEFPDEVKITEKKESQITVFEVRVASSDMGKVIGKEGQIAKSIRILMKAVSSRQKTRVSVEFVDWLFKIG